MNNGIYAKSVQVISADGQNLGIMPTSQALELAMDQGLDLVEMNANGAVPITKIMDYGKFKYEQKKRASEARKNQKTTELKEVWIKPFIEENDLNIKLKNPEPYLRKKNWLQMLMIKGNYKLGYGDVCISPKRFKKEAESFIDEFSKRRAIDQ